MEHARSILTTLKNAYGIMLLDLDPKFPEMEV